MGLKFHNTIENKNNSYLIAKAMMRQALEDKELLKHKRNSAIRASRHTEHTIEYF